MIAYIREPMKRSYKILQVLMLFIGCIPGAGSLWAATGNNSVFSKNMLYAIDVRNTTNATRSLPATTRSYRLFIFLSPECPLCQRYSPLLRELFDKYNSEVAFYGIVPGKAYSVADVQRYRSDNEVPFDVVLDESKALTNYLQATVTPQVILLNNDCKLVYKGAVDNLLMELGKQRTKVTEDYLNNALQQTLKHQKVQVKRTKAVGCKINDI